MREDGIMLISHDIPLRTKLWEDGFKVGESIQELGRTTLPQNTWDDMREAWVTLISHGIPLEKALGRWL